MAVRGLSPRYERHPSNYLALLGLAAALCCHKRFLKLTTLCSKNQLDWSRAGAGNLLERPGAPVLCRMDVKGTASKLRKDCRNKAMF